MEVILLERVAKLGQMGESREGAGRLRPQLPAAAGQGAARDRGQHQALRAQKAQLEARNLETKKEAEKVAGKLDGQAFVVIRSASESGALYGSVTTRDVADGHRGGFSLDRRQVQLDRPIKELGLHELTVSLHPEVDVTITLNVARSAEEAELQARASRSRSCAAEEEAAAEFEIAELFDDIGEKSVSELEQFLGARQAAVSQQLARLRLEGLVTCRREGKSIYYALGDPRAARVITLLYDIYCAERPGSAA
jgi:large subunit ribosomal protein L9